MALTPPTFRSITFGTSPKCEVRVDDPLVSPFHCRVSECTGGFYVEDMGTTNGTWIRRPGRRETRVSYLGHTLKLGEHVRIGNTILPWEAR